MSSSWIVILACPSMRLTGSMVIRFMPRSLSELHFEAGIGLLAVQQVIDYADDSLGGRRASRQREIHLHEFAQRPRLAQQSRQPIGWYHFFLVCPVDIDPLQQFLHGNGIAHARDITGYGAVTHGNENVGALADFLD